MAYEYNPNCYIQATSEDYNKFNYIGEFDFTQPSGKQDVGGLAVVCTNSERGMRGLGCYFKNISNEINDFDGYYAIAIDNNDDDTSMSFDFITQASDRKSGTVVISVDGKPLRLYITELRDGNNNSIIPRGGVNLGEIEMKVHLYDSQTIVIGKQDDGGVGANSLFYAINNFIKQYNPTLESTIEFKNKQNSFSVKLGDRSSLFKILNIENLSFSSEEISIVESAYADGDIISNSRALPKDIPIELEPDKNKIDVAIQSAFAELYKKEAYIQWKTTRWLDDWYSKDWKIYGTVNEVSAQRFTEKVSVNIILHCSNPFWQGNTVSIQCGHGGKVTPGDQNPNVYFFRTNSQNTGVKLNLTTNGVMSSISLPTRSNFIFALYTYEDIVNKTGRTLLQKMQFNGTYGILHYPDGEQYIPDGVNYDIDISTVFREKNAIEKIEPKNMIDDMTNDSKFLIINQKVCEIDFGELFTEVLGGCNPYVTLTYTPLYIG